MGSNTWKKGRKTHILGKIRGDVLVQVRAVSVQVVLCFSILTNVRILVINFSFLI